MGKRARLAIATRFPVVDFTRYPSLAKYLQSVDVHPRSRSDVSTVRERSVEWLTFLPRGGAYSHEWMVDALCNVIRAKVDKYSARPSEVEEFHLLVHYDKAFIYNTPVRGLDFGYAEAVQAAAVRIGPRVGVFDKVFVYVPVSDGQKVFRLHPA